MKDGTSPSFNTVVAFVEGLANGVIRYPRFKSNEVRASQGAQHEQLWRYILSLESAKMDGRGVEVRAAIHEAEHSAACQKRRSLGWLGEGHAQSPLDEYGSWYKFLDRGVESHVFDAGDGTVVKVRPIHPLSENDVLDKLANLVYHNFLFPDEAYTLEQIARHDHDGTSDFYLILRQPFVTPKTTEDGYIIAPTEAQIRAALVARMGRYSTIGTLEEEEDSSSDSDDEFVPAVKMVAFNEDFVVHDFQPGRNTFIDATTGTVRFIDPRISLNDPSAGFVYSKYGHRRPYCGNVS